MGGEVNFEIDALNSANGTFWSKKNPFGSGEKKGDWNLCELSRI